MTEEATEIRTVRTYRHEARRALTEARSRLKFRTDATGEIYNRLNGAIEDLLRGRQGLSQEAQVTYLNRANEKVNKGLSEIPTLIEQAREELVAQIDAALAAIQEDAGRATEILTEAATFAAERDFAAHQERKGHPVGTAEAHIPSESDYEDDAEDDEDTEDDED